MSTVKERILEAARRHFREVGTRNARVQVICEAAGVSRTSFYREFANVDEVAASLTVQRWARSLSEALDGVAGLPVADAWREFIAGMTLRSGTATGWGSADDQLIHILGVLYRGDNAYLQDMVEVVRPFIEQGQQDGFLRTDVSVSRLADWLFRQIWAMTSVPFAGADPQAELRRYIDAFVLPPLFKAGTESGGVQSVLSLLAQMDERLVRMEQRLPG